MRDHWLGIELRHLAVIDAIASAGSFRGAAARLGYAQSAISQQIAFLERHCGVRLVERSRGGGRVRLTDAGRVLLAHAEPMISRLQAARADLATFAEGRTDQLRIGVDPAVGRRLLPALLAEVADETRPSDLVLVETSSDEHRLDLVEHGDVDVIFVALPIRPGPFAVQELLRDRYMLLVPAGSRLAQLNRAPTMDDILDVSVIGAMPDLTLQALVAAGQGVAIVPKLAIDHHESATVAIELADPPPPRILGLAWHADRHLGDSARAFLAAAQRQCRLHGEVLAT